MLTSHEHTGRRILSSSARFLFSPLIDFIYPPFCLLCETRLSDDEDHVCSDCWNSLPELKPAFAATAELDLKAPVYFKSSFALFEYSQAAQTLVHEMKYRGASRLASRFGRSLAAAVHSEGAMEKIDALVPVPLHSARLRERGYNQAHLIARQIANDLALPVISALKRIRATKQQAKYNREQRLKNVMGAFQPAKNIDLRGKHIALVDDVLTTGSTLNECARRLHSMGAQSITALTIVRI